MSQPKRQSSSSKAAKAIKSPEYKSFEQVGVLLDTEKLQLREWQPRRSFNPEKMERLTESVKLYGILEPLIVRPLNDDKYELVAGERRYRAAQKAGLSQVPVTIRQLDEHQAFELALVENMQRDDLNPIDETEGMLELLCQTLEVSSDVVIQLLNRAANAQRRDKQLTDNVTRQIEVIDRIFLTVGRSNRESFRTNRLPLLNLPEDVLEVLRQGKLEYTKAKLIAKLERKSHRRELMELSINERLTLSQIKRKIREIQGEDEKVRETHLSRREVREIQIKNANSTELIQGVQSRQEVKRQDVSRDLYAEFKKITQIRSDVWNDESKKSQIESLLDELKRILGVKF